MKNRLLELRKKILRLKEEKKTEQNEKNIALSKAIQKMADIERVIPLDDYVSQFINEYRKGIKNMDSNTRKLSEVELKKMIEKIATFYEFQYPENKVYDLKSYDIKKKLHISDLYYQNEMDFPIKNEFEYAIENDENFLYYQEGILDCVMYRIIERGGNRIGPRRGFLFAKEFGRNIHIPIKYGIDLSDPYLEDFIKEYLKIGGIENLVCYENYHLRKIKNQRLEKITVKEVLEKINKDKKKYLSKNK